MHGRRRFYAISKTGPFGLSLLALTTSFLIYGTTASGGIAPAPSGSVTFLGESDWVAASLGANAGITSGEVLCVYDGETAVGCGKVESLKPEASGFRIGLLAKARVKPGMAVFKQREAPYPIGPPNWSSKPAHDEILKTAVSGDREATPERPLGALLRLFQVSTIRPPYTWQYLVYRHASTPDGKPSWTGEKATTLSFDGYGAEMEVPHAAMIFFVGVRFRHMTGQTTRSVGPIGTASVVSDVERVSDHGIWADVAWKTFPLGQDFRLRPRVGLDAAWSVVRFEEAQPSAEGDQTLTHRVESRLLALGLRGGIGVERPFGARYVVGLNPQLTVPLYSRTVFLKKNDDDGPWKRELRHKGAVGFEVQLSIGATL